jgi:O-antigen ligase
MLNEKQIKRSLWIFSTLIFLSFVFPEHAHPYRGYFQEAIAVLAVLMTLSYFSCLPKTTIRIPKIVIVPFTFIVIIVLQVLSGMILYPIDIAYPIMTFVSLVIALICGATLSAQTNGLKALCEALAYSFMVAGLTSVLIQHVQIADIHVIHVIMPLMSSNPRPYGNLAQPNLLALLFCFSITSTWYLYLQGKLKPVVALVIAVLLLWGLALTQSRIAWIILPLFLILSWQQPRAMPKVSKVALALLLLLFIVFVLVLPHFFTLCGIEIESLQERAGHISVRSVLWQQAFKMSTLHPWFGAGWLQFKTQQLLLSNLFSPTEYADNAHNMLLNFAAEIGWPLTLLFFCGAL